MVYLAVNKDCSEVVSNKQLKRFGDYWVDSYYEGKWNDNHVTELPKGSIEKLIGRKLTWEDDCEVEIE